MVDQPLIIRISVKTLFFFQRYINELAQEIKGCVSLNGCEVIDNSRATPPKLSFVLISALGKSYELLPKSQEDLDEWVTSLQQAIQSSYEDLEVLLK